MMKGKKDSLVNAWILFIVENSIIVNIKKKFTLSADPSWPKGMPTSPTIVSRGGGGNPSALRAEVNPQNPLKTWPRVRPCGQRTCFTAHGTRVHRTDGAGAWFEGVLLSRCGPENQKELTAPVEDPIKKPYRNHPAYGLPDAVQFRQR